MRPSFLVGFAALGLASTFGPAEGQSRWGPNQVPYCEREATVDECRAHAIANLIAKLELPTAEALAQGGYSGIRIFRYDAFGNIWPAVTVMSRPTTPHQREGFATATTVHADGHVATMSRPIWEGGWRQVDAAVEAVLDAPPPSQPAIWDPASGQPPPPPPCLDAHAVKVEVIAEGQVTRWSPPACQSNATLLRVTTVIDMVAAAFPACGHLPIETYGHSIGRLRACLLLEGPDPVGTIPVLEAMHIGVEGPLTRPLDIADYDTDIRLLVGDGPAVVGPHGVDAALKAGVLGRRRIRIIRFSGNGDHVVVHGLLHTMPDAQPSATPFTQIWSVSADGVAKMREWRVP